SPAYTGSLYTQFTRRDAGPWTSPSLVLRPAARCDPGRCGTACTCPAGSNPTLAPGEIMGASHRPPHILSADTATKEPTMGLALPPVPSAIERAWLLALFALWALLLFGGFAFGRANADRTRRMPIWTRMGSSLALVLAAWSWWLFARGAS